MRPTSTGTFIGLQYLELSGDYMKKEFLLRTILVLHALLSQGEDYAYTVNYMKADNVKIWKT